MECDLSNFSSKKMEVSFEFLVPSVLMQISLFFGSDELFKAKALANVPNRSLLAC